MIVDPGLHPQKLLAKQETFLIKSNKKHLKSVTFVALVKRYELCFLLSWVMLSSRKRIMNL